MQHARCAQRSSSRPSPVVASTHAAPWQARRASRVCQARRRTCHRYSTSETPTSAPALACRSLPSRATHHSFSALAARQRASSRWRIQGPRPLSPTRRASFLHGRSSRCHDAPAPRVLSLRARWPAPHQSGAPPCKQLRTSSLNLHTMSPGMPPAPSTEIVSCVFVRQRPPPARTLCIAAPPLSCAGAWRCVGPNDHSSTCDVCTRRGHTAPRKSRRHLRKAMHESLENCA